jgi:uncharacterized phiE125 gp8 family phage protein
MGLVSEEAAPAPVTLDEVKAFLRLGNEEEDALVAGLVRSAAETCERFTGRALVSREVEEVVAASGAWTRLGIAPVQAIEAVAAEGGEPLPAGDYAIDIDAAGDGWVRVLRPVDEKRVRVRYRAGLAADPNGVPEALRHGIVRLTAHLYAHREDGAGPPFAVAALWRPWRRLRLS